LSWARNGNEDISSNFSQEVEVSTTYLTLKKYLEIPKYFNALQAQMPN
jgi:hypothetical protein